jgi:hypothetical protein
MLERVNSMIQSHIDSKDILGTDEKEKIMDGIDTGLNFLPYLLESVLAYLFMCLIYLSSSFCFAKMVLCALNDLWRNRISSPT